MGKMFASLGGTFKEAEGVWTSRAGIWEPIIVPPPPTEFVIYTEDFSDATYEECFTITQGSHGFSRGSTPGGVGGGYCMVCGYTGTSQMYVDFDIPTQPSPSEAYFACRVMVTALNGQDRMEVYVNGALLASSTAPTWSSPASFVRKDALAAGHYQVEFRGIRATSGYPSQYLCADNVEIGYLKGL